MFKAANNLSIQFQCQIESGELQDCRWWNGCVCEYTQTPDNVCLRISNDPTSCSGCVVHGPVLYMAAPENCYFFATKTPEKVQIEAMKLEFVSNN